MGCGHQQWLGPELLPCCFLFQILRPYELDGKKWVTLYIKPGKLKLDSDTKSHHGVHDPAFTTGNRYCVTMADTEDLSRITHPPGVRYYIQADKIYAFWDSQPIIPAFWFQRCQAPMPYPAFKTPRWGQSIVYTQADVPCDTSPGATSKHRRTCLWDAHAGMVLGETWDSNIFIREDLVRQAKELGVTSAAALELHAQSRDQNHDKKAAGNSMGEFTKGICQSMAKLFRGAESYNAQQDEDRGIKVRMADSAKVDCDDRNNLEKKLVPPGPADHPNRAKAEVGRP